MLSQPGLNLVMLVTSDALEEIDRRDGLEGSDGEAKRCRVHSMRNALAHAGKNGRQVVSVFIATAFAQNDAEAARRQWRAVADQLRPKMAKLAAFMDDAEADVLAYMSFPAPHRAKLHSTNPLEWLNGEIKRRTKVVGILASPAFGSPTKRSSFGWPGRSCSNRTTNGPPSAPVT